jgi:hypothetical protein
MMQNNEFSFLFRQSDGTISASLWRRWTLILTGLCLASALLWRLVSPWTERDLSTQDLFDLRAFIAFVYLLVFVGILLLSQVSQYNLSAKRFRAKDLAPGWAAVWPLSVFGAGAAFWAQPNFFGLLPAFVPWLFLLVAVAAFLVQFFELGFRPD